MQLCFTLLLSFPITLMSQHTFDLKGHRGCRLMPENTLPALIKAVELGVSTLEMDVVISGDGQVVVSHEPRMSHEICLHPDGRPVEEREEKKLNLYLLSYAEIQMYDCGMKVHPRFKEQKKMKAVKPTLAMVVDGVRKFVEENNYKQPYYNIEIKSVPSEYNVYQPDPDKFVEMVAAEIQWLGIKEITTIQSFDINVLEVLNKRPGQKHTTAYLVEKGKDLKSNLEKLTFKPDIYSPLYTLVSEATIIACHQQGIGIIP